MCVIFSHYLRARVSEHKVERKGEGEMEKWHVVCFAEHISLNTPT